MLLEFSIFVRLFEFIIITQFYKNRTCLKQEAKLLRVSKVLQEMIKSK